MTFDSRTVDYQDGDTVLQGYLACPAGASAPVKPSILIAHMWGGRVEFVCEQARRFAERGHTAFALDLYGKGITGKNNEENARLMQPFMDDRQLLLRRMRLALQTLQAQPEANANNIVAVGYCFGGLCVLDLARSGAELSGVVSMHGLFDPPPLTNEALIKAKVLILHGEQDPLADMSTLADLQNELDNAYVDWQVMIFSNTMHAFTNPAANDVTRGTVYNPLSSRRAWRAMLNFIDECSNKKT